MADNISNTTPLGSPGGAADATNPAGQNEATQRQDVPPYRDEAKSHFSAAIEEAKAGAAALKDEAKSRASSYREQAKDKSEHWSSDAKTSASGLAVEGKAKASGALMGLSRVVEENAPKLDENLGPRYGDYARNASRSIRETAEKLDQKSVEELGQDARTFVREQPGTAVGLAALAGFLFARIFRK